MPTVAVTAASSPLAAAVLRRLDERPDVRRIVAIDEDLPSFVGRAAEHYRMDVRDRAMRDVLAGCDAVVHLPLAVRARDAEGLDLAVAGTRNVLDAAAAAAVSHVVIVSSAMAYGAHPDNDVPLAEDAPLRAQRDVPEAARAAEVEEAAAAARETPGDASICVLRPALVVADRATGLASLLLDAPWLPSIEGCDPPMQFVHEDDVAAAALFAIDNALSGAYNVGPDDWLTPDRVASALGRRRVVLSSDRASALSDLADRLGLREAGPSLLPFLMYPWVVSGERLRVAGFAPARTSEVALDAAAATRRGRLVVGGLRLQPRTIAAGAAGAAVVSSMLLRVAWRWWRRLSAPRDPRHKSTI